MKACRSCPAREGCSRGVNQAALPGVYTEDGPAVSCWPTLRAAPGVSPAPCWARSPRSHGQMPHPGVGESRRQGRPVLVDWFHAGPNKGQREPVVDRAAGPLRPPRRGTEDTPARRQVGFGAARRAEGVWVLRACARPPTCTGGRCQPGWSWTGRQARRGAHPRPCRYQLGPRPGHAQVVRGWSALL